jgi:uncharacterized protein
MTTPTVQIALPMDELRAFCERWGIVRFALFGSVLREDFGPESDVDVLAWFGEGGGPASGFEHVRMEQELTALLGRRAEVVSHEALMEDPDAERRHEIEGTSQVVVAS